MKHISAILVAAALSPVVKGYAQEQVKDSTLNRTVVVEISIILKLWTHLK